MRYEVLVSDSPVTFVKSGILESKGLVVPYLGIDSQFNIYAYRPEDCDVSMDEIRGVHYFESQGMYLSEEEFKSFVDQIEGANKTKAGDKVKALGYMDLVTEVIDSDSTHTTTFINLRGSTYRFKFRNCEVFKNPVVYPLKLRLFKEPESIPLILDLAEFKNSEDYFEKVFNFIFRVKLSYPKGYVILLNPEFDIDKVLGFRSIHTSQEIDPDSLNEIRGSEGYLYSRNLELFTPAGIFLYCGTKSAPRALTPLSPDDFFEITGVKDSIRLRVYREIEGDYGSKESPFSRPSLDSFVLKQSLNTDFEGVLDKHSLESRDCEGAITVTENNFDFDRIFNYLMENNHISILENLDYHLAIMRG